MRRPIDLSPLLDSILKALRAEAGVRRVGLANSSPNSHIRRGGVREGPEPRLIRAKWSMAPENLSEEERAVLANQLERLREEHRDLDAAIEALRDAGQGDQLQLQRLKKRKLLLRDRLTQLEDALTPDIIA